MTFDSNGRLLIVGGEAPWVPAARTSDTRMVYRSNGSFADANFVASVCKLTIPSCGTGIQCWPETQSCDRNCVRAPTLPSSSTGGAMMRSSSSSTGGTLIRSSSTSSAMISSSSTGSSPSSDASVLLGCSAMIPAPGSAVLSFDLPQTPSALVSSIGSTFGSKIVNMIQQTASNSVSVSAQSITCANVSPVSGGSKVVVYVSASAGAVASAIASNFVQLQDQTRQQVGGSANNLIIPQNSVVSESTSNKTSVGLTVGMAFLGLGIGLIFALCIAFYCITYVGTAGKHTRMENEAEMSKVGETA